MLPTYVHTVSHPTKNNHFDLVNVAQSLEFQAAAIVFGRGGHWPGCVDSLGGLGSLTLTWTFPLRMGYFLGGGGIGAVDLVAWAAWALGGWHEYTGQAGINCMDLVTHVSGRAWDRHSWSIFRVVGIVCTAWIRWVGD